MFGTPVDGFSRLFKGSKHGSSYRDLSRAKLYRNDLVFGDNNFLELKLFPLIFKKTKTEFINE